MEKVKLADVFAEVRKHEIDELTRNLEEMEQAALHYKSAYEMATEARMRMWREERTEQLRMFAFGVLVGFTAGSALVLALLGGG